MKKITCLFILFFSVITFAASYSPKLVVQLVVDQLRGDLLHQHQSQFGQDGFNYLLNHSVNFYNAHHPHARTTTCVGHATIATGSYPAMHGIIDNEWFDRKTNKMIYCMEDLTTPLLPTPHMHIPSPGRSPHNLKASTLSDEIILANRGKAFAVSLKDRSAITLAGHAGKAFWFDKKNGGFITSRYYYTQYPLWVEKWNKDYIPIAFTWELSRPKASYQNANVSLFPQKDRHFGQTFPHTIVNPPSVEYFDLLSRTPKADQLTADFAERLLVNEHLGQSATKTDYLAISFSAVDVIGHQFGPNSLEAEDNLLLLDQTIAKLLHTIDENVGLEHTLVVLTADHGVSDGPYYLRSHHIAEIKPLDVAKTEAYLRQQLLQRYQLPPLTLMSISPPYVYLNHQIVNDHHLSIGVVSQFIADVLSQVPGVFKAYPLPVTYGEKDWIIAKVERMAYPNRSGDVYIVQPPYQSNGAHSTDRVSHGSPWEYDSYVPLLFVNPHLKPQRIYRQVYTTDIAPTLAALLMIKSPSATVGQPLPEILEQLLAMN